MYNWIVYFGVGIDCGVCDLDLVESWWVWKWYGFMLLNLFFFFYKWDFFVEMMLLKFGGFYVFCMWEIWIIDVKYFKLYILRICFELL